jgi:hypothetical protein
MRKQSFTSNKNLWGDPYLNTNFDLLDEAIGGYLTLAVNGTSTTLTTTSYGPDQARKMTLVFTGTAGGTVVLPSNEKFYNVINNNTGGMILKTVTGTSTQTASIPAGAGQSVACDGTSVVATPAMNDFGGRQIVNIGTATATNNAVRFDQLTSAISAASYSSGAAVVNSTYSATTTATNPGAGFVSINNATLSSATAIYLNATDTSSVDQSNLITSLLASSNSTKAYIRITKSTNSSVYANYSVSSVTNNSGWYTLTVTYLTGSGSFTASDLVAVSIARAGDAGLVSTASANTWTGAQTFGQVIETDGTVSISSGTMALNLANSNEFYGTLNAAITSMPISNPATAGKVSAFSLTLYADGTSRSVTWPTSFKWAGGTAPTLTTSSGKQDVITALTRDAGTSYLAIVAGQNF